MLHPQEQALDNYVQIALNDVGIKGDVNRFSSILKKLLPVQSENPVSAADVKASILNSISNDESIARVRGIMTEQFLDLSVRPCSHFLSLMPKHGRKNPGFLQFRTSKTFSNVKIKIFKTFIPPITIQIVTLKMIQI